MALKRGTQVCYVPTHANGDLNHPDVERGFVTSVRGNIAFCRYWRKGTHELRTTANSEATPVGSLVEKDTVPQYKINELLEMLESHPFEYQVEF